MRYRVRRYTITTLLIALALGASGEVLAQDSREGGTTYDLLPSKSKAHVRVRNASAEIVEGWSHGHVIAARDWHGAFTYDPDAPGACELEVVVPVDELAVDPSSLRREAGLGTLPEDARRETRQNMLAPGQLAADTYPTVELTERTCEPLPGDEIRVKATLTVRGEPEPVSFTVRRDEARGTVRARGSFELTHSDFGFEPYSKMMGALANAPELTFYFDVIGRVR